MTLSFVIPAYNEENYIRDCLEAILKQKNELSPEEARNIEIVVVNNASTDQTAAIVKKYPEVKLVDEPTKGILFARRAGFVASTGELVANIDADTCITPGWMRRVLDEFARDPRLVALSGPFIYYDAPPSVLWLAKLFNGIGYGFYLFIRFVLHTGSLVQGGNYVVRRDALQKIGGYDTTIDFYGEDTDVARRLNQVGKVKFTFKLPALSSGRRLAKEGVFTIGIRYAVNILSITFLKHPHTRQSIDVRFATKQGLAYTTENPTREWILRIVTSLVFLAIFTGVGYALYWVIHTK